MSDLDVREQLLQGTAPGEGLTIELVGDGDLVERQQSQFRQVFQVTQAVIRKRHVRSGPVVGAVGDPREAFASKRCRVQMQNL